MAIRPAKEKDLKECAKILHTKEVEGAGGWYPNVRVLKRRIDKNFFLVAEENKKVLGCIIGEPLKFGVMIWWFAIDKKIRGKGIGSALLGKFEKNARKNKKFFIVLYARTNSKAVKFYRKKGYSKGHSYYEMLKDF